MLKLTNNRCGRREKSVIYNVTKLIAMLMQKKFMGDMEYGFE